MIQKLIPAAIYLRRPSFCFVLLLTALVNAQSVQAKLHLPDGPIKQGQTIEVLIDELDSQDNKPALKFQKLNLPLFAAPQHLLESQCAADTKPSSATIYASLLPIPADLPPGKYNLSCGLQSKQITVTSGRFPLQKIRLPKSKDNFIESPGEQEAVEKAKATVTSQRFWQDQFLPPSKARTSTIFGVRRMVNGKLLSDYFHSGLDFAGGLGSPVTATAAGKVILAKTGWRLHGNTVAIDHGQGVISFYIHLQKILVKPDQMVKAGELIGRIGQTGRANGPHLHFSIYVNQTATNPINWFNQYF